jgi:hypothetical protein
VWVADVVLDVVQVFSRRGEFRDVLRAEDGRPLKLAGPMGLTFDHAGDLYVVELRADRVRKFTITADPRAAPGPRATAVRAAGSGNQDPSCTLCHLEWLPPFHHCDDGGFGGARGGGGRCTACHRVGGHAPAPAIATHPPAEMSNPTAPEEFGHLPLFNGEGEVDVYGRISCRTCHLPHGRLLPAPVPAGGVALSSRELRARSWHLRSFGEGNVCATCHGFDALRRFMYFHDPARRGGPLTTSWPSTQ